VDVGGEVLGCGLGEKVVEETVVETQVLNHPLQFGEVHHPTLISQGSFDGDLDFPAVPVESVAFCPRVGEVVGGVDMCPDSDLEFHLYHLNFPLKGLYSTKSP